MDLSPSTTNKPDASHLDLNTFVAKALDLSRQQNDPSQLLKRLGQLLVRHANCSIVFDIELPTSADSPEPAIEIIASRFSECPQNIYQWGFSTAVKAASSGSPVLENSESTDSQSVSMIAMPLEAHNPPKVLSAMFIGSTAEDCLPFMRLAVQQISRSQSSDSLTAARQTSEDVAALHEICFSSADSDNVQTACRRLANNLKSLLARNSTATDVDSPFSVYVGTISGKQFPKLTSISDTDSIPDDSRLIESVESAMAECISRNENTSWPPLENNYALVCHKNLSDLFNGDHLRSYVLPDSQGNPRAVLVLRSPNRLSPRIEQFFGTAQTELGIAVSLAERNERNKLQQWFDRFKQSFADHKTRTILKAIGVICLLGMIPLPYQIKASSEVQPAQKTFLYAPFSAPLKTSYVEPGDLILASAELATLDDRELSLELAEVEADLHRAQKKRDGFVATHEPGEARLARHEAEMLQAQLEILQQRSQQLVLRSPIDGIVIAGDWKTSEGMPLETGQSLFEIAPLEKLSIDIFLPEDDVRYAKVGQNVKIRFDAYPFESFNGTLSRIHPSAETRDNENVFVATMLLDNPEGKLRPGMKGKAKCQGNWRPIWWNLLHKPTAKCLRYFGW